MNLQSILYNIPEVKPPVEKKLGFNVKLKWTLIILVAFFVLANIPLYGLAQNSLEQFEYLAIILGTDFGSIISLGIGPIVMASIILQLLVGSGLLKIDTNRAEGKRFFQGLQKIGVIVFIVFEAMVYVLMGGLQANPGLTGIVIFQLIIGGFAIMFMDEVTSKWGFGSGISLFIVAGVSWRILAGLLQFISPTGENCLTHFSTTPCSGALLIIIQSVVQGTPNEALLALLVIVVTVLIFLAVVWAQSLKVEIPLSYDRLRGYNIKWPLAFFYASVLPVILVSALIANIQLFGGLLENSLGHATFLGSFSQGQAVSGLAYWLGSSNILEIIIRTHQLPLRYGIQAITHLLFFMFFSMVFAIFWVKTAGMDAASQAKKIISSGLQIPGFRKDERVLESILSRYILSLTVMGGLAIGLLAAITNSLGALTSGTAILLAVMIMYQLYQNIAQQHAVDMHPALKNMVA
ncbi:preprotein translocase subunit SecY [Candidatus Pacearchaeota archaeon CG10_big_fil_rev_8_21_14_0_10_31_24]|nr:MAG: preprotein translocase subunit SecY [Candidatus Pacearchaeota archaeon CG10_big_fil_rev_8_21_14_0_10_31_24]